MKLILSTRNPSKANQIKAIFSDGGNTNIKILTLDEAEIEGEAIEDGKTLHENAFKKALYAWERAKMEEKWAIADDTGFFIDALGGAPGIHAARWAGDTATTKEIMNFTLEKLKDIPEEKRTASFRVVASLINPKGEEMYFEGEVRGRILKEPRSALQPKMPYSSMFVPEGYSKVWAEMTTEEENKISHRGQAFKKLKEFIEKSLGIPVDISP